MSWIFTFLMSHIHQLGELKKASLYGESCSIDFEKGNRIYQIYISSEDKKEEQK